MKVPATRDQASATRDYRSVEWFGTRYEFNPQQAACVGVLWRAWLGGTPIIREGLVLEQARARFRTLKEVFRLPPGKSAWGTMIGVGDRRGTVRLVEPAVHSATADPVSDPASAER